MSTNPMARLLALLTAFLMFVAPTLPATASEGDDGEEGRDEEQDHREDQDERDEDDDKEEDDDEEERKVQVETGEDGIKIKLERERAAQEDKIEMSFDFEDAEFKVKFEAEAGDVETEMKLEAQFLALTEYRDTNNNSRYDRGEPIMSAWSLSEESEDEDDEGIRANGTIQWLTPTVSDVTVGNQTGKRIRAPAQLGETGRFELVMTVFGDFVDLGNASLKPTSVKIDIVIQNYPYRANDTALALFLQTESKSEHEVDHDHDEMEEDEEGVAATDTMNGQTVSLVFTWKDSATVDGEPQPVHTTTLRMKEEVEQDEEGSERERKELFALSYARGDNITHDPEAFVSIQSGGTQGMIPGPGLGLVAGVIAATAMIGALRRKEGSR